MADQKISIEDQFQIGDKVLYVPENVRAMVTGYLWSQAIDGVCRVLGYELDVGITVPRQLIRSLNGRARTPSGTLSDRPSPDV